MMEPVIRARDLGINFPGRPGPMNAITDVAGVQVGFCTLTDPAKQMRTGVTAVLPRPGGGIPEPVWAGWHALNGNGEMTGTHWIEDAGYFIGPVMVTNTHGIGAVHHGTTRWMMRHYADFFAHHHGWAMPVVAETYDGTLNDITALHVTPEHAEEALANLSDGPVAEGAVGGGNGMIAYEFKGGTGTASRLVRIRGTEYRIGALVQANHGMRDWLTILGRPVGMLLRDGLFRERETGSIIVILVTDAPLSPLSLRHLAKRAGIGIGRGGTPSGNSSGDIFLACSTANAGPMPQLSGPLLTRVEVNHELLDPLYLAAVEAVEESVINAMVAGRDTPALKPEGLVVRGISHQALREMFGGGS